MKTSTIWHAQTEDALKFKLCSKIDPKNCCNFQTKKGDLNDKGDIATFSKDQIGNCYGNDYSQLGGIGHVWIKATGMDGWRGDYINIIHLDDSTIHCPINKFIDDLGSGTFDCSPSTSNVF